jgi:hypothetical protein
VARAKRFQRVASTFRARHAELRIGVKNLSRLDMDFAGAMR